MKQTVHAYNDVFVIDTEAKLKKDDYGYHNSWWLVKIMKIFKNKGGFEYDCMLPNGQSLILKDVKKVIASSLKLKNMNATSGLAG